MKYKQGQRVIWTHPSTFVKHAATVDNFETVLGGIQMVEIKLDTPTNPQHSGFVLAFSHELEAEYRGIRRGAPDGLPAEDSGIRVGQALIEDAARRQGAIDEIINEMD
jgi:hypothetical protein